MMRRVLITGASGLLGRYVAKLCVELGWTVWGIAHQASIPVPEVQPVKVDLSRNWPDVDLPRPIDVLIHLAQSDRFRDFPEGADDLFGVNVAATAQLLHYARNASAAQFIYASSGGVYQNRATAVHENSAIQPLGKLGPYLASKMCGEILVQSFASEMTVTILRPFFIYGPQQKRRMLIPRLYDNVLAGRAIQLQGAEGVNVNPIHVVDAAQAVIGAIQNPTSSIYNIAGPDILSIRQIAMALGEYLGRDPVLETVAGVPQDLIADIALMRAALHDPCRHLVDSWVDVAS